VAYRQTAPLFITCWRCAAASAAYLQKKLDVIFSFQKKKRKAMHHPKSGCNISSAGIQNTHKENSLFPFQKHYPLPLG